MSHSLRIKISICCLVAIVLSIAILIVGIVLPNGLTAGILILIGGIGSISAIITESVVLLNDSTVKNAPIADLSEEVLDEDETLEVGDNLEEELETIEEKVEE